MENFDYQGKRRNQVEFSEKVVGWGMIGIIIIISLLAIYNLFSKL